MIANLDDAVAICVLAKIPFADKIHIERALPFTTSICGYRSVTGDRKNKQNSLNIHKYKNIIKKPSENLFL